MGPHRRREGMMAAPRRVIEISIQATELIELEAIARSRTEWACRVQRARILLAYHADPSTYAVGEATGVIAVVTIVVGLAVSRTSAPTAQTPGPSNDSRRHATRSPPRWFGSASTAR